jgi:uncharacterized protein (DUF362 family)
VVPVRRAAALFDADAFIIGTAMLKSHNYAVCTMSIKNMALGAPVASRLAIASTDFIAADRVGVECMGVDAKWVGYLRSRGQVGLGNYDMAKIDIGGPQIASVQKKYQLAGDVERQLA